MRLQTGLTGCWPGKVVGLMLGRVVVGQEQGKLWVAYWSLSLIKLFTKRVRGSTGVTGGVGDR